MQVGLPIVPIMAARKFLKDMYQAMACHFMVEFSVCREKGVLCATIEADGG